MKSFKVIPLAKEIVEKIQMNLEDGFGHKLTPVKLSSRALCRYSLSDGDTGSDQKHILFSYMPVKDINPYSEVGPVYIIANSSAYEDIYVFPPDLKKRKFLTLRGYSSAQLLIAGEMSEGHKAEEILEIMFKNPDVEYILVSDASSGCFFVKIERAT
jgi:hypothetical protein